MVQAAGPDRRFTMQNPAGSGAENFAQAFKHLSFNPINSFNRVTASDTNENDGISSNGKMIAVNWKATSSIAVFNADKPLTFESNTPLLKGHSGNIFDMQWSPFQDRLLATCADDGKAKFWVFDDFEGLTGGQNRSECDLEIEAHPRKCISVQWHEAAENLIATHSIDKTIKVWDINEDKCDEAVCTFTGLEDVPTSIRWSPDGKMICGMVKNKSMVIFDPRQEAQSLKTQAHPGPRQQRMQWADSETILTSGFDTSAKRQYAAWDIRNLDAPLIMGPLGEGSGVTYLHYDMAYQILLTAGRGDNTIGIYHFDKASPTLITEVQQQNFLQTTQKGFAMCPKSSVDVSKQEVMRSVRVTNTGKIDVLAMRIPSKVGGFNQDYYPPFNAREASSTAEAWCNGEDVPAKTMQMSKAAKTAVKKQGGGLGNRLKGIKPTEAPEETKAGAASGEDADALRFEVLHLKQELAAAKASAGAGAAKADDVVDFTGETPPTLGYWKIRGLAAPIRYMFYQLGVHFSDVTYDTGDAPDYDKSSWLDVKQTLGLEYPNLPYLIDENNGVKLTETVAIMQYIAKKYRPSLCGTSAAEVGRISMLLDKVSTLKGKSTVACYTVGDAEAIIEECRPMLAKIVEVMGGSDWIAGANLSWLDFYFAENLDMLNAISDGLFYAEFPSLQTYWDRFIALPNLCDAWANDDLLMKAPFNNKMAKLLNN